MKFPDTTNQMMFQNLFIRVLEADSLAIGREWDHPSVRSPFWRLYVHNKPGANLVLSMGRYPITPQAIHFVPPWVLFTCKNENTIIHDHVSFDLIGLSGNVVRSAFPKPIALPAALPNSSKTTKTVRSAIRGFASDRGMASMFGLKSAVALGLEALLKSQPVAAEKLSRLPQAEDPLWKALERIEHGGESDLTVPSLAASCHMSTGHFSRKFSETLGQSPSHYVREKRVAEAARQLLFTADSIEEVAEAAGFADRHHFSRVFKQSMGVPPAAYRKQPRG